MRLFLLWTHFISASQDASRDDRLWNLWLIQANYILGIRWKKIEHKLENGSWVRKIIPSVPKMTFLVSGLMQKSRVKSEATATLSPSSPFTAGQQPLPGPRLKIEELALEALMNFWGDKNWHQKVMQKVVLDIQQNVRLRYVCIYKYRRVCTCMYVYMHAYMIYL